MKEQIEAPVTGKTKENNKIADKCSLTIII